MRLDPVELLETIAEVSKGTDVPAHLLWTEFLRSKDPDKSELDVEALLDLARRRYVA
jgi:hypothetical protein